MAPIPDSFPHFKEQTDEQRAAERERQHMEYIDRREALADDTADYYGSLIKRNVPDDLARALTRQRHALRLIEAQPYEFRQRPITITLG